MHRLLTGRHLILLPVLVVLQYSFSSLLPSTNGRPDFFYLLILDYAFFSDFQRVPFFALTVGLFRDFIGGHLFGIETLSLSLTASLLYFGMLKLERDSLWVRFVVALLFVAATETLSVLLGTGFETSIRFNWGFARSIFLTTLYTAVLAPGFFWFTGRWFHRVSFLKQYELFH